MSTHLRDEDGGGTRTVPVGGRMAVAGRGVEVAGGVVAAGLNVVVGGFFLVCHVCEAGVCGAAV